MKTRCFDHIDLRVKNMEVAIKFYGQFLPQLGFVRERHEPSPRLEAGGDFGQKSVAGGVQKHARRVSNPHLRG